jgi:hypothetical protein
MTPIRAYASDLPNRLCPNLFERAGRVVSRAGRRCRARRGGRDAHRWRRGAIPASLFAAAHDAGNYQPLKQTTRSFDEIGAVIND